MKEIHTVADKVGWKQWLAIAAIGIVAYVLGNIESNSPKWQDAVIDTIVLYGIVLVFTQPLWRTQWYWTKLSIAFVLHWLLWGSFLLTFGLAKGLGGVWFNLLIMLEGSLVIIFLIKGVPDDQLPG